MKQRLQTTLVGIVSRAPYGARGLKQPRSGWVRAALGRAPYGARGLKLARGYQQQKDLLPRPVRGAWVETAQNSENVSGVKAAPRTGRVG